MAKPSQGKILKISVQTQRCQKRGTPVKRKPRRNPKPQFNKAIQSTAQRSSPNRSSTSLSQPIVQRSHSTPSPRNPSTQSSRKYSNPRYTKSHQPNVQGSIPNHRTPKFPPVQRPSKHHRIATLKHQQISTSLQPTVQRDFPRSPPIKTSQNCNIKTSTNQHIPTSPPPPP